jgi:hypothetical protein
MGLPFQRSQKNDQYAYYPISDADDSDSHSEYTIASSSDGYRLERGRHLGRTSKATRTPAGRREVSAQSVYVATATQKVFPIGPRPPYTASIYSTSLKASTSCLTLTSSTAYTFNTPKTRTDSAIDLRVPHPTKPSHTRIPSAIEMQSLTPIQTHRYPPGIVIIKTFDDHGVEVIEETDLTHRGTPYIDLKPTVTTREVHSGMVQKTARTGLMERALEKIVDALGTSDGD